MIGTVIPEPSTRCGRNRAGREALARAGRDDFVLYTGNDDTIVPDLVTRFEAGVECAAKPDQKAGFTD